MEEKISMRGDAHHHLGELTLQSYVVQATRSLFCSIWWRTWARGAHDRRSICAQRRGMHLIQSAEVAHAGSIGH